MEICDLSVLVDHIISETAWGATVGLSSTGGQSVDDQWRPVARATRRRAGSSWLAAPGTSAGTSSPAARGWVIPPPPSSGTSPPPTSPRRACSRPSATPASPSSKATSTTTPACSAPSATPTSSSPRCARPRSPSRPGSSPPSRRPAPTCGGSSPPSSGWTRGAAPAARWSRPGLAIRRAVEAAAIPHTYVACNYFAGFALPSIGQFMPKAAPVDSVVILGDGATKVVFVEEGDIGTYTVLAAVDPRAENKTVHIRPPANTLSHDELVTMWENKTGNKLERVYVPEDAVLNKIKELAYPMNILVSIAHAAYCGGR